jgi:hypothetical protein
MKHRLFLTVGLVVMTQFVIAGMAGAKGIPVTGLTPDTGGVTVPGRGARYVTFEAIDATVLARLAQEGGNVIRARSLDRRLTTPPVALEGSAGGLSADGDTLVLVPPRIGLSLERTKLEIFEARTLRSRGEVVLRGDFSFDAISPDGSRVYLIEYLSPRDPTQYRVRAYDLDSDRLLPRPIVDPSEPPGEMRGYPLTRATSEDGRWAYTLYDGGGDDPFIHALDTVEGRAVCIDVHQLANHSALRGYFPRPISRFELAVNGGELSVLDRSELAAVVDTATFEVSDPSEEGDGGGVPWLLVALASGALLAAWVLAVGHSPVLDRPRESAEPAERPRQVEQPRDLAGRVLEQIPEHDNGSPSGSGCCSRGATPTSGCSSAPATTRSPRSTTSRASSTRAKGGWARSHT